MFNKHWSSDAEVTVLGYGIPPFELPDNFKFISLGEQEKYGRDWTSALIPFFEQLPDEYFVLLLDDFYISNIDKSLLQKAERYAADGVEKIHLTNFCGRTFKEEKDVNFNTWEQDANYRLSLQPSIVRRDYFLKYLKPGKTVWEYELQSASMNDGAQILVSKKNIVFYSNFMTKGRISDSTQTSKIKEEDLIAIKQLVRLG